MSAGESLRGAWRGWALLLALAASACGQVPGELPEEVLEAPEEAGDVSAQGYERQGRKLQGFARRSYEPNGDESSSGPVLQGFSLRSLAGGTGSLVDTGVLVQGTLEVHRSALLGTTASLDACASATTGLGRSCGWKSGGQWRCAPGTFVTVGTGVCGDTSAEDTVLRVCRGSAPCEHSSTARLTSADDGCGTYAARASFTCPSTGSFTVLVGHYRSDVPLKATLEAETGNASPSFNIIQTQRQLEGAPVEAFTEDGSVIPMRITSVREDLGPEYVHAGPYGAGTTYRYSVKWQRTDGTWESLCGPDVDLEHGGEGLPAAIPVAGYWGRHGFHYVSPNRFTFSCGKGVITKCYRWGYRPWDDRSSQSTGMPATDLHQACTRMARADYCGNGTSWTVDNTDINLWDTADIQQHDATTPGHEFEAGWMPWGATCLHQKRWSHAPDDVFYESCPNLFEEPNPDTGERVPRYCASMKEAQEKLSLTPLFNESAPNQFPGSGPAPL